MSYWKIRSSMGGWFGVGLIVIILIMMAAVFSFLTARPIDLLSFFLGLAFLVSALVLAIVGFWVYSYYTLYYTLDRDAFRIHWGGFETTVPIAEIRGCVEREVDTRDVSLPFLRWPGYCIGKGAVHDLGDVSFFTTGVSDSCCFVLTETTAYVISPDDPEGFRQALELRQSLQPVHTTEFRVSASRLLGLPFWSDRLGQALWILAWILNLSLFAYLSAIYPQLMPTLPFHFNMAGEVDRIAPAAAILFLPAIGMLCLFLNSLLGFLLHSRYRAAALLLWSGTSVIQSYLWIAALGITAHGMAG